MMIIGRSEHMTGIITVENNTILIKYDQEENRAYLVVTDESDKMYIGKIKLKEVAKNGTV
jgi:hypothetical protein